MNGCSSVVNGGLLAKRPRYNQSHTQNCLSRGVMIFLSKEGRGAGRCVTQPFPRMTVRVFTFRNDYDSVYYSVR